ncbi:hypothetical protein ACHQM5_005638 [Ranunculus cassubicifolius]
MAAIAINSHFSAPLTLLNNSNESEPQPKPRHLSLKTPLNIHTISISPPLKAPNHNSKLYSSNPSRATLTEDLAQEKSEAVVEVAESLKVLKNAAKTRKVKAEEVLAALDVIKNAKFDSSEFLQTLGGNASPGKTWMLIFTTKDKMTSGSYFPITAVQRFDAAAMRIENGVYLGPLGNLTFEGKFSWKKKILAFIFETIKIKVGIFPPLQISLGKSEDKEPSTKDPFFIWFYIDEEIAVAQGKGGGTAFWCRCRRVM